MVVKRVSVVARSVNLQLLFKLLGFADVKEKDMPSCYFTRRYDEVNEENKENYLQCVLCNGANHIEEKNFLIYNCLCNRCIRKMEPICRYCVTTNEFFNHLCECKNSHRYNLTSFIW